MRELNGSLEENVLTLLCWSPEHSPVLAAQITPDLFSTSTYQTICERSLAYIDRFRAPPRHHLPDILEKELKNGHAGYISQILRSMEEQQGDIQPVYVFSELDNFLRIREMEKQVGEASQWLKTGNLDEAQKALSRTRNSISFTPGIKFQSREFFRFLEKEEDGEDSIPIGITAMERLHHVPKRKTLTIFLAPPGKGKSWFLVNVGKHALMHGKSVLHLTLEMSEDEVASRYAQAVFSLSRYDTSLIQITELLSPEESNGISLFNFHKLERPGIMDESVRKNLIHRAMQFSSRAPLWVKEFPTAHLAMFQFRAYLDNMERNYNFKPDVIIVDYADLFAVNTDNYRLGLGEIIKELRGLAVTNNAAVFTASQTNRESAKAKLITEDMVAEDWSKIATADHILTYNQNEMEEKKGLARFYVAKWRGARGKQVILASQNYEIGQFCLGSREMNAELFSAWERL